jgi:hypothetical protein
VEQKWHRGNFSYQKVKQFSHIKNPTEPLILLGFKEVVAGGGIEPPTQGFSVPAWAVRNFSLKFTFVQ